MSGFDDPRGTGKGRKGNSISGKVSGFEGYYNYFNVRAYASGGYDAVEYGLLYAKSQGWNTHKIDLRRSGSLCQQLHKEQPEHPVS